LVMPALIIVTAINIIVILYQIFLFIC
jgi:hypothetical protein